MSDSTPNEHLQDLLANMYRNIVQYAPEDLLAAAERSFYSTRDYALGDIVSCSAGAALENCEQIKSYLGRTAPLSAIGSIQAVEDEIRRLEDKGMPSLLGKSWILIILAAVAYFTYFVMTQR